MMDYRVARGGEIAVLEESVALGIKDGFIPFGALTVVVVEVHHYAFDEYDANKLLYLQPMYKETV